MQPTSPATLLDALNWRYATKKFDPARKLSAETWAVLEQALVLAPSSFGLQPWKFLVITDADVKAQLVPLSWGQKQPADCSHMVVFAVKQGLGADHVEKFLDRQVEVRGGSKEKLSGYRDMMLGSLAGAAKAGTLDAWQTNQIYIALGQFMAAAALIGVVKGASPSRARQRPHWCRDISESRSHRGPDRTALDHSRPQHPPAAAA
jgi:nitroreductase